MEEEGHPLLSPEQARRIWEALPAVSAAFVEHGPDLIDRFVSGEALLRHLDSFSTHTGATRWQRRLRELLARPKEGAAAQQPDPFAQVTRVLHTLSMRAPLLLAIDDLQWADSGTEALLFHLGRRLAGSRILLVCACRPQEHGASQADQVAKPGFSPGIRAVLQELSRQWGDILVDLDQADGAVADEEGETRHLSSQQGASVWRHIVDPALTRPLTSDEGSSRMVRNLSRWFISAKNFIARTSARGVGL